ncbi:hypothetical protein CEXT_594151 [Caerostris extrusa]|uniref:Uncharacterized protein n=1 Tax=Caerostris extrusa TaxID=172846 RepID=A0AAV4T1C1_CAEEX|nr:hypothetical protein CEXT_594151 [Caerostris extrusa]
MSLVNILPLASPISVLLRSVLQFFSSFWDKSSFELEDISGAQKSATFDPWPIALPGNLKVSKCRLMAPLPRLSFLYYGFLRNNLKLFRPGMAIPLFETILCRCAFDHPCIAKSRLSKAAAAY